MGYQTLSLEELTTLCKDEINSNPLPICVISDDPKDVEKLIPAQLMCKTRNLSNN